MNQTTGIAAETLRNYITRIERLEEEKAAIADDIKEVYAQAKGDGYDVKILKNVIKIRKKDPAELSEEEMLTNVYLEALGNANSVED